MTIVKEKIWIFVFALLAGVLAAQLVVSNVLAGRGSELVRLEEEVKRLERDNNGLSQELAKDSSLNKINTLADSLGFTKPEFVLYINLTEPVAFRPSR